MPIVEITLLMVLVGPVLHATLDDTIRAYQTDVTQPYWGISRIDQK